MVKREKRLEKGITSLEEQKKIHEEKRRQAEELGEGELIRYYDVGEPQTNRTIHGAVAPRASKARAPPQTAAFKPRRAHRAFDDKEIEKFEREKAKKKEKLER